MEQSNEPYAHARSPGHNRPADGSPENHGFLDEVSVRLRQRQAVLRHDRRGKAFGRTDTRCGEEISPNKYRIWCSDKWDHAGAVSSWDVKLRMEFYPDEMPDGMVEALESAGLMETS
jgi:hypothetical protein